MLAVLVAVGYFLDLSGNAVFERTYPLDVSTWLYPAVTLIQAILEAILFFVVTRTALALVDGKKVEPSDLIKNLQPKQVVLFILASILYVIAVGFGLVLLIAPGLYLMTKYGFYGLAIVDKGLGVSDSFRRSSGVTKGHQMELLPLYLLSLVVGLALGFIHPLLSGASLAFFYLAFARAYRSLS